MSTDALEHLQPHEVAPMVREFTRVARRRLFLHIAMIPERQEVQKLHDTSDQFDCVTTLHTLHILCKRKMWLKDFARAGWSIDPAARRRNTGFLPSFFGWFGIARR